MPGLANVPGGGLHGSHLHGICIIIGRRPAAQVRLHRRGHDSHEDPLWEALLPVLRKRRPPALLRALAHVVQALDDQQRLLLRIPIERRLEPHRQRALTWRARIAAPALTASSISSFSAMRARLCARTTAFSRLSLHSARRCSLCASSCLSFCASSKVMYGAQRSALVAYAVPQSQSSAAATGALA